MVFKSKTVRERLKFLQELLDNLETLRTISRGEFLKNFEKSWSAEHGLHLAAEAVFDIGNHILVGHFGENPKGYEDVIPRLVEKEVLLPDLGHRFSGIGGFRNILVHEYSRVDKEKVYERLQNGVGDFRQFSAQILKWMESLH
ncbi:MAG: DUF86 domain-containing protein [Deltaproteobacteria bacterium]|nr:DUF86 domain-containing protein [Deltaproteobacteria bacterium]MBI4374744.1 DUF86 domain-containing protein [Deltaproteobacteria bacterium]